MTALVLASSGCGAGDEAQEKASGMTPDQAKAKLAEDVPAILRAGVGDGGDTVLDEAPTDEPCGGVGGNEYTKVQYSYGGVSRSPVPDGTAAVARARDKAVALGYEASDPMGNGTGPIDFSFTGTTGGGSVQWRPEKSLRVQAQTGCLDNPDR